MMERWPAYREVIHEYGWQPQPLEDNKAIAEQMSAELFQIITTEI